jgi:cell division protein FtsB
MQDRNPNIAGKNVRRAASERAAREPLSAPQSVSGRALDLGRRIWRPAGTLVAFALALLLTWHVINGKHGLNVWLEMRTQDKQLQRDIHDLDQENARLRDRIEHLKTDPDTIMIEARQKLHYAKPDEVIVALPADKSDKSQPASASDSKK